MLPTRDGAQYITQLLDEFKHTSLYGIHIYLIFKPMSPSVNIMVEKLPQFNPPMFGTNICYPPRMAKGILRQSLQALLSSRQRHHLRGFPAGKHPLYPRRNHQLEARGRLPARTK
ncbi:hypothetical protein B0T18DRAFT_56863 [Schizothecium vesticola]|uniref:Uncharacterized protein n=1 Tax=Schizothecium vesticola TaxID=314040 RepID=A0AA40F417_9PEZI|nr:hypothetical protein B0T18DRAFT_56863 [Schizothecium vesticola]